MKFEDRLKELHVQYVFHELRSFHNGTIEKEKLSKFLTHVFRIEDVELFFTKSHPDNFENTEYNENNQLKASYLRGVVVDEIINGFEKDSNDKLINRSFHHDQVNSVIATTDHTGATTQTNQYSPFGLSLNSTGTDTNALKYTGRESDSNGLYYYRARYYDPFAGRFISEDPIGFKGGINFYAYVNNNPLRYNDPSGQFIPQLIGGTVNAGVGALLDLATGQDITWQSVATDFGTGALGVGLATNINRVYGLGVAGAALNVAGQGAISGAGTLVENVANTIDSNGFSSVSFDNSFDGVLTSTLTGGVTSLIPGIDPRAAALATGIDTGDAGLALVSYTGSQFINSSVSQSSGYGLGEAINWGVGALSPSGGSGAANGGFVLYPNKINTNFIRSVYSK